MLRACPFRSERGPQPLWVGFRGGVPGCGMDAPRASAERSSMSARVATARALAADPLSSITTPEPVPALGELLRECQQQPPPRAFAGIFPDGDHEGKCPSWHGLMDGPPGRMRAPLVDGLFDGYNATILAYGQTGR